MTSGDTINLTTILLRTVPSILLLKKKLLELVKELLSDAEPLYRVFTK